MAKKGLGILNASLLCVVASVHAMRPTEAVRRSAQPFRDGLAFAVLIFMLDKFEAFKIASSFYRLCKRLKVPRFLHDQLMRASSSIALNLAEGSAKRTDPDKRRFYGIAFGSLRECQAILELEEIRDPEVRELADHLGAILFKLSHKTASEN